ncbi:rhomboid family intramembrane serine protease GlpG [Shewanella sp. OPT22]|nr:rhomboid family intramembrane serine protease GlpG [Shewanella sp. OPT22]
MHLIGLCPNERVAQTFYDYMKLHNVECHLNALESGVEIFIADENMINEVQSEFDAFMQQPFHSKYTQSSWEVGDTNARFNYGSSSTPLVRQFLAESGPFSLSIFIICVAIFALMNVGFGQQLYDSLSFYGATNTDSSSQVWRLITPIFIHFSLSHILSNLLWWWYFGGKVEKRIGITPLLTLVIAGGILPNTVQYWMSGPNFGGLSGVVYALLAYVWVVSRKRPDYGLIMPPALIIVSVAWIILGLSGLLPLPIGNGAHLAGFVVGLVQGWVDCRRPPKNSV